jgi:hypothetical protein
MSRARDLGSSINSSVAGKNVMINGAFDFWQRGNSFNVTNNYMYVADRWMSLSTNSGGSVTVSRETFTPGSAPTSAVEGTYYLRNTAVSPTGASYNVYQHKIEDVRTFAGQTVTLSFWAKADSAKTVISQFFQNFGSGGSNEVYTGTSYPYSVTTSWQRYATTLTLPSISGKTVAAGNNLRFEFVLPINSSHVIDIWGVQLELGSSATQFSRAGGDIQGELAKCQRYYYQTDSYATASYSAYNSGNFVSSAFVFPVTMRIAPAISVSDIPGNANRMTQYPLGGNAVANITPPSSVNIKTTHWFYEAGGTSNGSQGTGGAFAVRYIASSEL